jgi:hypothetical protein
MLLAGAVAGTTAALGAVGVLGADPASAATVAPGPLGSRSRPTLPTPRTAPQEAAEIFRGFAAESTLPTCANLVEQPGLAANNSGGRASS